MPSEVYDTVNRLGRRHDLALRGIGGLWLFAPPGMRAAPPPAGAFAAAGRCLRAGANVMGLV